MRGFTLIELVVVIAILALVSIFGLRYYFTNVEMYRFQNALTEFKSSVNTARARSISGLVSTHGMVGDTPAAFFVTKIVSSGNDSILTTASGHHLTGQWLPCFVSLMGFCPTDTSYGEILAKKLSFPWYINGPMFQVKTINGDTALTVTPVDSEEIPAANVEADLKSTAAAFLKNAVRIRPVKSVLAGQFAKATELGPTVDFQYVEDRIKVDFKASDKDALVLSEGTIVFDKGLTAGAKTYEITLSLLKEGDEVSKVTYKILPAGAVR